ncbi:MAG: hypothetical protein ACO3KD_01335 [Gaiellales bacterium]
MPRRLDRETRRPGPGVAIAVLALCALVVGYVGMVALRDGGTTLGVAAIAVAAGLAAGAVALRRRT